MKKIQLILAVVDSFAFMAGTIDLSNRYNYSDQNIPNYIGKNNTGSNL